VYLEQYAKYEREHLNGDNFHLYKYDQAQDLMRDAGYKMPGLIHIPDQQIKEILEPARISAQEAYRLSVRGEPVAHVGHALIGTK